MKIKVKPILPYIFVLSGIITISCTTRTVYHHYNSIDGETWNKTDTASFILPDSMKEGEYNIIIGIRHTAYYPYRDLWLSLILPDKETADTVHLYLANDRGNWNGNGTASGYYQYEADGPAFNYANQKDSIIKLSHIMKESYLPYISDVGIKICTK